MKKILMAVFIIMGGIVGCGLGQAFADIDSLKWLSIGSEVGFKNPLTVDLSFIQFTIGFWCKINIAGILCLILFAFISSKIFRWLKG